LHVTQGTADKKPTTGSATQNSLNVLSFDGADFLQRSSSNVQNNDQTWFLVAQVDSGGIDHANDSLFAYGNWDRWEMAVSG
jgi:hypothetical protein